MNLVDLIADSSCPWREIATQFNTVGHGSRLEPGPGDALSAELCAGHPRTGIVQGAGDRNEVHQQAWDAGSPGLE